MKKILALILVLLLSPAGTAFAASRYWVGGGSSANWSATGNTNWSATSGGANNASVPSSGDDVFFDGVGGGASNSTLDTSFTINSIDFNGYSNTFTHETGNIATVILTIAGSGVVYRLSSTMTYSTGATNPAKHATVFTGTSGTTKITMNGKNTTGAYTINGPGGTFQFQDAFTNNAATGQVLTLTAGTLDANNQAVTILGLSSSNTNTRAVLMGSNIWTLVGALWDTSTTTGLTLTPGASTIKIQPLGSGYTFNGGGLTYNNMWITGVTGSPFVFTGTNTFNDFKDDDTSAHTITFPNVTTTVSTFTVSGVDSTHKITLARTGASGTFTLSASTGQICRDFLSISNSAATGGASWFAGANSTNGGGNSGWTFTACPAGGFINGLHWLFQWFW